MTIRPLSGLALAAVLAAAPAAPAQLPPGQLPQGQLPQGVVLRPGERLVTPQMRTAPTSRYGTPQYGATQYRAPQYAAPRYVTPTVPQSSGVVRVGGVQSAGGIQQAGAQYAPRPINQAPMQTQGSTVGGSDQARAQAEANLMASRGIRGHVGGTIGAFEGVGWSSGGMPNTCTPGRAMQLTADAVARGPGGVYRVRAWR